MADENKKTELDIFLEKKKEKELKAEILNEPGRDLSDKFLRVGKYSVVGTYNEKTKRWDFETDSKGIVKVDKSRKVESMDIRGNKNHEKVKLPLEKILAYNARAILGKGGAHNPAIVWALA